MFFLAEAQTPRTNQAPAPLKGEALSIYQAPFRGAGAYGVY